MSGGDTRTLVLPSGGTMEIPLPGTNARFAIKQGALSSSEGCSLVAPVILSLVLGAAVGATVAVWWLRPR